MPIPKHFVQERESNMMADTGSASNSSPVPVQRSALSSGELGATRKKRLTVRWEDDQKGKSPGAETDSDNEMSCEHKLGNTSHSTSSSKYRRNRSPSPPVSLTSSELQELIRRQESSIRQACKVELKLLNQSKRVREKRVRMVERLKRLKRKARKYSIIKANDFLLPPVFCPGSKAAVIDMTKQETIGDRLLST